jgi:hypothetical protein
VKRGLWPGLRLARLNFSNSPPSWHLKFGTCGGQQMLDGVVQCVRLHRNTRMYASPRLLPPWQAHPPLPDLVSFDLSYHYTQRLLCPARWEASKRNVRIILSNLNRPNQLS